MEGDLLDGHAVRSPRRRRRLQWHAAVAIFAAALACTCASPTRPSGGSFVFVGAGDIANHDTLAEGAEMTARLIEGIPGTVFTAGDNAYPGGSADDFRANYDPTWGRFIGRTYATIGNHDTQGVTNGGLAYFDYFGAKAGPKGLGYYPLPSLGNWTIYSLNSETDGTAGSVQWNWLRQQLLGTASPRSSSGPSTRCTLAIWHRPMFSSGGHGNDEGKMRDIWKLLYDSGADIVITAHDHLYERFSPQDTDGRSDPARGIREFIVGTGGGDVRPGFVTVQPNSEVRLGPNVYGVLKLTLSDGGYTWEFLTTTAGTQDFGSGTCH